jgi:hypothetical protein
MYIAVTMSDCGICILAVQTSMKKMGNSLVSFQCGFGEKTLGG